MLKIEALAALGGSVADVAREIGITPQAVGQWPEELPLAIRDRVQAALWRRLNPRPPELIGTDGAPAVPEPAAAEQGV